MAESFPPSQGANRTKSTEKEPILVRLDPECLHSALKEFFEPSGTSDPRTNFFATYRKEAAEFDRDYAKKCDEDLSATLIFAGLFSAVSSAFIIDIQSKFEPNPNDITAAYMQILIHAVNSSLFPNADLGAIVWNGPSPGIVAVQALLYTSLATSLSAVFVASLGKQSINRYIRNRGGSAADKCRDRQRKLDGFEKWHFHLIIESLPIVLQLSALLLGCALTCYLWAISHTVAGVLLAITLFGVSIYVFLTLAATIYYSCPYQLPLSIIARPIIKHQSHSNTAFSRSLRFFTQSLPSIANLKRIPKYLRFGVRHVARIFGCVPLVTMGAEHLPLAAATATPARVFEDVPIDWEVCNADVRCISWMLDSTTDIDVIFSTVRFAADTIWYPEIAGALSPHTLADLFFDCLLEGQIIPSKLEHAISIGMALASVLSVQLNVEPEDETLKVLCQRLRDCVQCECSPTGPRSTSSLVVAALRFVAVSPSNAQSGSWPVGWVLCQSVPDHLSTTRKLWLTRVVLQRLWPCQKPITEPWTYKMESLFKGLMRDDGQNVCILRTNCFLIAAISLGLQIDFRDLYPPNNMDTLKIAARLFDQQFQDSIKRGNIDPDYLHSLLLAVTHLDPLKAAGTEEIGLVWISEILDSGYPGEKRCLVASEVVRLLGGYRSLHRYPPIIQSAWVPPLLKFLSLCENFPTTGPPPHPGLLALQILSDGPRDANFCAALLPVLASMLLSDHPHQSRKLALTIFFRFSLGWFSSQMETVPDHHLNNLLRAVGDPFRFPPEPPQEAVYYEPMRAAVVLIEFASSELWRSHLHPSNFASCEDIVSTDQGRRTALREMFSTASTERPEFLCTPVKIATAIRHLEELGCLHTAQVVIMWAWTVDAMDAMDRDGGRSIEGETLRFYRTHGIRLLAALKRSITQNINEDPRLNRTYLFVARHGGPRLRVGRSRRSPNLSDPTGETLNEEEWETYRVISQACQLRRLYHLFRYDPTTWQEAVGVEEIDEEMGVSSERPFTPDPFIDWECDYP